MLKFFLGLIITTFIFLPSNSARSQEFSKDNVDKLANKVSTKFARTFCNTSNFGISDEGAIEFASGETKKQFSKNKLINYLDLNDLGKLIASKIEIECQVYDFPLEELTKLDFSSDKLS